ncbi:hypothetical protein CEY12_04010 [Chryseobacterium sp. T16E-39]|uniref:DUF3347 domain-containing protein n=1 Tax=Chryseobacterium sp. T16E-39 TaxID=2015076 RepID=UPI000B5B4892|nr:DUF3347 domain-containing protein [Chryseobacterium sp. T16E-39]ASK29317.1 hypothetical protein CEY12_04010 [Chryseobacterium sp. T16E-39]
MKNIFLSISVMAIVALTLFSCKKSTNRTQEVPASATTEEQSTQQQKLSDTALSAGINNKQDEKLSSKETPKSFSIDPVIKDYLILKNALVADNDQAVAHAGKQLLTTLKSIDMKIVPADKHKEYMDIADDAKENAEHIGDNAGKIDHQREHMASLSKDMSDLIELFGTTQKLYQDYCPMYNDGKGAIWISEAKAIKNPYYGNKMLTCGSVKKEY